MNMRTIIAYGTMDGLDLNCAEKILYAANEAYELGLEPKTLKLAAGFGGGMGCELTCGALCGGVMVLSCLFVRQRGHESGRIKALCREYIDRFRSRMGADDCQYLRARYWREDVGCRDVILVAAEILDGIIEREKDGSFPPYGEDIK